MDLTQAAIQEIAKLQTAAIQPRIEDDPTNPWLKHLFFAGGYQKIVCDPPPRTLEFDALEDLVDYALTASPAAELWHDRTGVRCVPSPLAPDRASFGLVFSHAYTELLRIKAGQKFTQRELIHWLRVTMAGTVSEALLPVLRSLNIKRTEQVSATQEHQKDTLGRSIEQEYRGAGALPEEFDCLFDAYANVELAMQFKVRLALEVSFEDANFRITPLGDELARAEGEMALALARRIAEMVDAASTPPRVFRGRPD